MASRHELTIEIDASGQVQVKVEGAKGKQCMKYVELLGRMGTVMEEHHTSEYYEPEARVGIFEQVKSRFDR
jgi:hypothetical protein